MSLIYVFRIFLRAFNKDKIPHLAAALSFYITTALAPLILVFLSISSSINLFSNQVFIDQIYNLTGASFADILRVIIENTSQNSEQSVLAGIIGALTTLVAASAVFVQLNYSLDKIWEVKEKKEKIAEKIKKRIYFLIILSFFILAVVISTFISTLINLKYSSAQSLLLDQFISIIIFFILFLILFKYATRSKIRGKCLILGSAITSFMFIIGKYAIAFYVKRGISSVYGTLGSLLVILLWIYYSSIIFLGGAELTKIMSKNW